MRGLRTPDGTGRVQFDRRSWTLAAVTSGVVVVLVWTVWTPSTLSERVLRDTVLYGTLSVGLATAGTGTWRPTWD